jgi:hypothetical protein
LGGVGGNMGFSAQNLLFVVGVPRSGTTLLQRLISDNYSYAALPETHFLCGAFDGDRHYQLDSTISCAEAIRSISPGGKLAALGINSEDVLARISSSDCVKLSTLMHIIFDLYAEECSNENLVEKTPMHYQSLELLLNWFPHAKAIWIVRDPRAVASSYLSTPWSDGSVITPARQWSKQASVLSRVINTKRVVMVSYEKLVREEESVLASISSFLGKSLALGIEGSGSRVEGAQMMSEWDIQLYERASQPPDASAIEKWTSLLSGNQVKMVESICVAGMKKFQYAQLESRSLFDNVSLALGRTAYYFSKITKKPALLKYWSKKYLSRMLKK